jgi:hypothetical protein
MATDPRRVKLILTYDILAETQDRYYQYMLGEMVPAVQSMGLHMSGAWHTAYGEYPVRLVEFVADDQAALDEVLESPAWERLEARLQEFVVNYGKKIVRLRDDQFQF